MTEVAIVILNWNGVNLFDRFLPSVVEHSVENNVTLIIADNGSSDKSLKYLEKHYPKITTIDLKKNYGFAKGYNKALKEINAEYYVLLNSDVEVTANWIEPCIELMRKNEKIAAVQPKILSYNQKDEFEYAGAAGGFIDYLGYPFCRGRILNHVEKDNQQYNKSTPIFWASGAAMFVRASIFNEMGGFDGNFWAHMEEIDLCWRLKNRGYQIWYQPQSVVYHLGGGSLPYNSPQKVYLNFRNNLWMLYKNLPKKDLRKIMIQRMILDGVASISFLMKLNFKNVMSVLKAHRDFYKNKKRLKQQRKELQNLRKITSHHEIYKKSIIRRFFTNKKVTFSNLNL